MRILVLVAALAACGGGGDDGGQPDANSGSDSGAVDGPAAGKRVFVSSLRYPANLQAAGGESTGMASADALCQQLADAASLGGTYRAWLSTSSEDAIDHVQGTGPWYRMDGAMVFPNHASLGTTPMVPISIDEMGGMPDPYYESWTGTGTGGRLKVDNGLTSTTCEDWTSTIDSDTIKGWLGIFGQQNTTLGAGPEWTNYADGFCSPFSRHLYCFEQ